MVPNEEASQKFFSIINSIASTYQSPTFPPHVTLLSNISGDEKELCTQAQKLALKLAPQILTVSGVSTEDSFFRALYLKVQEIVPLTEMHKNASATFAMPVAEYTPHLSLLYGTYPEDTKQETVRLVSPLQGFEFVLSTLALYRTEGEVTEWEKIASFPLGTS